jgi:hypothetical protein
VGVLGSCRRIHPGIQAGKPAAEAAAAADAVKYSAVASAYHQVPRHAYHQALVVNLLSYFAASFLELVSVAA